MYCALALPAAGRTHVHPAAVRAQSPSRRLLVGLICSAVSKPDDRSQCAAAGPIGASGGGGHAVAHTVEPGNRFVRDVQYLPLGVGLRSALGVERTAGDKRRVVRPLVADRPHGRIFAARFLLDVAVEQQVDAALAAMESEILASAGAFVEAHDASLA